MIKKSKITNNKKEILFQSISIASAAGVVVIILFLISYVNTMNTLNNDLAKQVFTLLNKDTQLQYCIDNDIKPCTSDSISDYNNKLEK
ncbi:MAG: hypothetical protein JWN33_270 [Candidatus Saccharibacteria bacterium]|nr:hypothetical protein [Candidatus Saccharibacteria bacterium]